MSDKWTCSKCGKMNVEYLLPVWIDANTTTPGEVDWEAELLSTWCRDCEQNHSLLAFDREHVGRWDT